MLQELCCQQVIEQTMPQLLKVIWEDGNEDFYKYGAKVTTGLFPTNYELCLSYARDHLQQHGHDEVFPTTVSNCLRNFLERYRYERLPQYADTFQQLANVIMNDSVCLNHVQPNMKWRLLEFMLSVNFKVFSYTRRFITEMEEMRYIILKSVAETIKSCGWNFQEAAKSVETKPSTVNTGCRYGFPAIVPRPVSTSISTAEDGSRSSEFTYIQSESKERNYHSEDLRLYDPGIESDFNEASFSLSLASSPPAEPTPGNTKNFPSEVKVTESFGTSEAMMELTLNLMQMDSAVEKPTEVKYFRGSNDLLTQIHSPWWLVDVHVHHQRRMLCSTFNQNYGKWLLQQHRHSLCSVRRLSEEHQVVRELAILFFVDVDTDHFKWTAQGLELRLNGPIFPLLAEILVSIEQMRQLRHFIDMHAFLRVSGDRRETLTSFSVALRRLLRPVVEYLIYFERRLVQGQENPNLIHFAESFKKPLYRLRVLYELSMTNDKEEAIVGSLNLLNFLFEGSSSSGCQRCVCAALLLHSLQTYCQFLESWWTTGEFGDWHDEFPYQRVLVEGQTEYSLREEWERDAGLLDGRLFRVIKSHVLESRQALAILFDSRRLGDFTQLHGSLLLQTSLHNALMEAVLKELTPYQTEKLEEAFFAPDIRQQLKEAEVEPVRRLFYAYHMETRPDPRQPAGCSADELLRNFQACVPYAPLTEIICLELERLLRRRSLLANAYISDLLKNQLQVSRTIGYLLSVFLLLKYDPLRSQFEEFFKFLKSNRLAEAAHWLREIVVSQDPPLGYLFHVSVKGPHPDFVSLNIIYDPLLNRVINQGQLEQLNKCFRLILSLHFTIYEQGQLRAFQDDSEAVNELKSLREALHSALKEQLLSVGKIHQFSEVDFTAHSDSSLEELHQTHKRIVQQAEEQLQVVSGGRSLKQVLYISRVLKFLWLSVTPLTNDQSNESMRSAYLRSVIKHCRALKLILELE